MACSRRRLSLIRVPVGLLAGLIALVVVVLLSSCGRQAEVPTLCIISPHGSDIRHEFQRAFFAWHKEKYGTEVQITWPDIGGGGTANIVKTLDGLYSHGSASPYDLAFGGGSATFGTYRERGYLVKPQGIDAALAHVPQDVFGTKLHGTGDMWIAATMSNFGIVYNKDRVAELGLATPRTWEDLGGSKWFGLLSLADPAKSGAVKSSYDQIFLQYGWEKGWGLIVRLFANADNIRDSGSAPADDVGSARAVAGIVIDFYGRKGVIRVGEKLAGFVIPEGGSTTDSDPIAMLKGAPHPELAAHFIEFVVSEEGQKLWTFRTGTPGGPKDYVLGRLSVLPEMYTKYGSYMFDPQSPFDVAEPLKGDDAGSRARGAFLGDLIRWSLIENLGELQAARRAVREAGDPPELLAKLQMLPTFIPTKVLDGKVVDEGEREITTAQQKAVALEFKPPASETVKVAEMERLQRRMVEGWRREFKERFREVEEAAKSRVRGTKSQ